MTWSQTTWFLTVTPDRWVVAVHRTLSEAQEFLYSPNHVVTWQSERAPTVGDRIPIFGEISAKADDRS